jgi:hypothetical protein
MRKIFLVLFAGALAVSCSRSEPKISFGTLRLVWYAPREAGGAEERYTFFVLPEDDDGFEDLADLYLYHDREGLYWHFTPEDWVHFSYDGKEWIGSRGIAMNAGESLPRGQFRAVVVDQGGEKSERTFTFDAPAGARYPFPQFSVNRGRYTANSRYPGNFVIFYDASGAVVGVKSLLNLEGSIEDLSPPRTAQGASLWAEDTEYLTSALTAIVTLP